MIKQEVAQMLNKQINKELHSGYLYMEFANYYESRNLTGFANWYVKQAGEEYEHAMKIRKFLIDANVDVHFSQLDDVSKNFTNDGTPLQEGLKHEQYITASIYEIYEKARELNDHLSAEFLVWFIREQCEEETNAQYLIDRYEMTGGAGPGLFMLNRELGER